MNPDSLNSYAHVSNYFPKLSYISINKSILDISRIFTTYQTHMFSFFSFSLHIKRQIKINNYSHTHQCTHQAYFNACFVFTYQLTFPRNMTYQVTFPEKRSTCYLHSNRHIKLELHINGHINNFTFFFSTVVCDPHSSHFLPILVP